MARPKYHTGLGGLKIGDKGQFFWTPLHQKRLQDIITVGFKSLGNAVFVESQRRVPVVTGNLKSSGSIALSNEGFEIKYTAPYATDVEVGRRSSTGAVSSQPWQQEVPRHIRRTKTKGNIWVAAHTKTYTAGKPALMPDGQWRVFNTSSVTRGRHFVGGALKSILRYSFSTNNGFQKYLQTDTI